MAQTRINTYPGLEPLEATLDNPPLTAATADRKVSWLLDRDTGTLETCLPDGSKLYLLPTDVEILYTLLRSAAPLIAECSTELTRRLGAGYKNLRRVPDTVVYLASRHFYQE